jgi:putative Mg2+ transporter-C (MgtC) family protein
VATHEWDLIGRIAVAFGLTFAIGFERQLRGGPAGDRTFALVGTAAAAISVVAVTRGAGNAIAGVITGVGFIGGALLFRGEGGVLRGITSATAVLSAAAIGVVAGAGYLIVALVATGFVLFILELRFIPVLSYLDGRRYVGKYRSDEAPPSERSPGRGAATPGPDTASGPAAGP